MSRFDWFFVAAFYTAGVALLVYGHHSLDRLAGCGLFGMLLGLCFVGVAAYHIELEDYR